MIHSKSPAHRRYIRRVAAAMVGYLTTLFAAEILIDDRGLAGPLAWLIAFSLAFALPPSSGRLRSCWSKRKTNICTP